MRRNVVKSAVVTGPTGAVGSALCQHLMNRGIKVYAVHHPSSLRLKNIPQEVTLIPCDLSGLHQLKSLIEEKVDAFFHLAWMHTIGDGRNDMHAQIENIRYAVDAVKVAADLGCCVYVGAGSQAEHGHIEGLVTPETPCVPNSGYGIAKLCAGHMTRLECNKLGIRHVWARILSAYGPGDSPLSVIPTIINKLLHNEVPALTKGEQIWDFCYSGDVADALYAMAEYGKDASVYPVGSGSARPLREYFEITRDVVNPSLSLGIGALPYSMNQIMHLQADISSLTRDTGWVPAVSFEEGIVRTVDSFCNLIK